MSKPKLLFLSFFLFHLKAFSYPEFVKDGYFRCISCHVSPAGSDLLSSYGRSISKEVLSRWGAESSDKFVHGIVKTPEWLAAGGHLRLIQTYVNSPEVERAGYFPMQAELGAAAHLKAFTFAGSIGAEGGRTNRKERGKFISPWYYAIYNPWEELRFRVGRFQPYFGQVSVNHLDYPRSDLGFTPGSERFGVEGSFATESLGFYLTEFKNRGELVFENGRTATIEVFLSEKNKLGLSYWHSLNKTTTHDLSSVFGQWSLGENFWIPFEVDFKTQSGRTSAASSQSLIAWIRPTYLLTKGLHSYLIHQYFQPNLKIQYERRFSYGVGAQFFPLPHLDLLLQIIQESEQLVGSKLSNTQKAWFIFHYYL